MVASLFVALVPPPAALASLAQAVERLRESNPGLGWVTPARWHVTLCFLGAREPTDELQARLARVASRHEAPVLQLVGAGRFGDRVLFAKLAGELRPLATGIARAAGRAGYEVEDRPFRAHLTLARGRRTRVDLRPLVACLAEVRGTEWRAEEIRLMRSAQPEYQTVSRWTLSPPATSRGSC